MRRALAILISLVAFAAVVIAFAPASLVGVALERASGGTVALAAADGTLWHGHGTMTSGRAVRVPVAWLIEPWPLLKGELRLHLLPPNAAGQSPHGDIVARRDTVTLRDVDVTLPANIAEGMAPRPGVRVSGDVRVATPSLDWTPATFAGGARIDWRDAQLGLTADPALRLGTVSATLSTAENGLTGPVTNEGGDYEVRGTLSLTASGAPNLAVTMTPRAGDSAQSRSLSIKPGADGNWNVGFRTGPP